MADGAPGSPPIVSPTTGLRQRRTAEKKEAEDARLTAMISAASGAAPPAMAKFIQQAAPAIKVFAQFLLFVGPFYVKMVELAVSAYHTLPMDILQALMGLGMCFFGGTYVASIAAVEAFYLIGWDTTSAALSDIYDDVLAIKTAHEQDDKKDDDGDGVADVKQVPASVLLQRKVRVAALAVKDPEKLSIAVGGLYAGWIAVQGTLRLQFAKTITLGVRVRRAELPSGATDAARAPFAVRRTTPTTPTTPTPTFRQPRAATCAGVDRKDARRPRDSLRHPSAHPRHSSRVPPCVPAPAAPGARDGPDSCPSPG